MALTQHFATRLKILEPRHDTTEKREKHTPKQGACLEAKTVPETSALELFLKHTAVASAGSNQDINCVSFCCFSPCSDVAACSNHQAVQDTGSRFPREKQGLERKK